MARKPKETEPTKHPLRLAWVDAAKLQENPRNWRTHPDSQMDGIRDAIREVGWAGALLYNARTKLFAGNGEVPVLIGSWTEDQEKKILATLDPLASLAEANTDILDNLLR